MVGFLGRGRGLLLGSLLVIFTQGYAGLAHADEPKPEVHFDPSKAPPASARWKLALLGSASMAAFYGGAAAASAMFPQDPGASDLLIPIAGPWLKLGQTKLCSDADKEAGCSDFLQVFGGVLLVLDGLGQAGSTGLIIESLLLSPMHAERLHGTPTSLSSEKMRPKDGFAARPLGFAYTSGDFAVRTFPWVSTPSVSSRKRELGSALAWDPGASPVGLSLLGVF